MKHHKFSDSSAIASIRHDSKEKILTVSFNSGSSHDFANVPDEIFDAMKVSDSAGKYFHQNIKGKYNPPD